MYVRFTESLDNLELIRSTRDISEISFTLQTHLPTDKACLPATPDIMNKEGPFFIKKSELGGLIQWILKKLHLVSAPYIGIAISEDTNTYSIVSHKKIIKGHESLMLFTMTYEQKHREKRQSLRAEVQCTQPSILWQIGGVLASIAMPIASMDTGLGSCVGSPAALGGHGGGLEVFTHPRRQSQQ